jgi:putative intracellular protease/amidase
MSILMVLTSNDRLGGTGKKTGLWLEEFATPYYIFRDEGVKVVLASPKGGRPPVKSLKHRRIRQGAFSRTKRPCTHSRIPHSFRRYGRTITVRFSTQADTVRSGTSRRMLTRSRSLKHSSRLTSRWAPFAMDRQHFATRKAPMEHLSFKEKQSQAFRTRKRRRWA